MGMFSGEMLLSNSSLRGATRGATPRVLVRQLPPPPLRGPQPTVSSRPLESMGTEGARRSIGNKGARRKILSILPPNILKPNPDPNAHPQP